MKRFGRKDSGNALLYVFIAVGLLGALTYSFVKGSRENYAVQNAARIAEEMYVQVNLMKSSVMQCRYEYTDMYIVADLDNDGTSESFNAADLDGDGDVDNDDNDNAGYPLEPTDILHANSLAGCTTTNGRSGCVTASATDDVRNLKCIGAPIGEVNMFTGQNNSGSFLPPKPQGFNEWQYRNDSDGVYLQITAEVQNMVYETTLSRLADKFVTCQAEIDFNSCGVNCFTAWLKRNLPCNP